MNRRRGRGRPFWPRRLSLVVAVDAVLGSGPKAGAAGRSEATVLRLRAALGETLARMDDREELFPAATLASSRVLALETRTEVRRVWASVYDRLLALRAIEEAHAGLRRGAGSFRDSRLLVTHRAREQGDYNFDFASDDTLVCSELVYKAYRERPGERGLALPLERTLGRPMMTPAFGPRFSSHPAVLELVASEVAHLAALRRTRGGRPQRRSRRVKPALADPLGKIVGSTPRCECRKDSCVQESEVQCATSLSPSSSRSGSSARRRSSRTRRPISCTRRAWSDTAPPRRPVRPSRPSKASHVSNRVLVATPLASTSTTRRSNWTMCSMLFPRPATP